MKHSEKIGRDTGRLAAIGGSLGAVVSAMGCAMCFPAIASLGGALGMGFLTQWEGLFVNTLLPVFGWLVLAINLVGWFFHRQWFRTLLGVLGPVLLLLSLYPWFQYAWSTNVTYSALGLMVVVSIIDFLWPTNLHCDEDSCNINIAERGEKQ